jgi:hypothetical protein
VEVSISTTRSRISREQALGWSAVVLSALISGFWAFWGIVENFHEGWYLPSLLDNLGLMLLQYLSPMLIFVALSFLAIRWPILGLSAYGALALFVVGFFGGFTEVTLYFLVLPLLLLGVLFWKGRPQPRQASRSWSSWPWVSSRLFELPSALMTEIWACAWSGGMV